MGGINNITYQSYCWVIGTTSFRTAKLNLKIEQQLLLLDSFYNETIQESEWEWNKETQILYYDHMKENGILTGSAKRKDKDARQKTSGLVDIGIINDDRRITEAGRKLLEITERGQFESNNLFNIDNDSYIYLKQLLKTTINVGENKVRPYIVLAKCMTDLDYLTNDEFKYLLPMAISEESYKRIIDSIVLLRNGNTSIEELIYNNLIIMDNYKKARRIFLDNKESEELICIIGMNRKSRKYDKPYYNLYKSIKNIFLNDTEKNANKVIDLFEATLKISKNPGVLWKKLLFKTSTIVSVKRNGYKSINEECPFKSCKNEIEIKEMFFKYLHVFKAMATLSDYFDLNRRYFNLTETIVFEDSMIKFDLIPKYFFQECIDDIFSDAFKEFKKIGEDVSMNNISPYLEFDGEEIYYRLSKDFGVVIENSEQAKTYVENERYRRFNKLVNKKFNDSVLLELLDCFEQRNDSKIEELVTEEADIPTIFEYVLGIIWYKVSERQGNILDFMKLSLEANLLPKTHAGGGSADIIYEYIACEEYPEHSLLIEATLSDGTNQRRMEMEPVSRHLGNYRIGSNNPYDYSLFISTYLHKNVVVDFRFRKEMPYYGEGDKVIKGMKIVSIDTSALKVIIKRKINYKHLYYVFDKYHEMPLDSDSDWHDNMIKEVMKENL